LVVLGFELKALDLLGKHSTTWTRPPSLFALIIFQGHELLPWGQPWTVILLPLSPVWLGFQVCTIMSCLFFEMGSCPGWPRNSILLSPPFVLLLTVQDSAKDEGNYQEVWRAAINIWKVIPLTKELKSAFSCMRNLCSSFTCVISCERCRIFSGKGWKDSKYSATSPAHLGQMTTASLELWHTSFSWLVVTQGR
jgi:hypothetical protein